MDMKTAYLKAEIEEKITFNSPKALKKLFDKQGSPLIFKLRKSLFGLKSSGRKWYLTVKTFLCQSVFTPAIQTECLFIQKGETGIEGRLFLCVDDMVILGLLEEFCETFKYS